MGIMKKIGAGIAKVFAGNMTDTAKDVADIVERWKPGETTKHDMAQDVQSAIERAAASARGHDKAIGTVGNWFDSFVNGINRLVRPTVTVGLLGGVMGFWDLPKTDEIDPVILGFSEIVLIFWFGGRALFKDLPALMSYIRARK